ncbi:hypothetical protein D6N97_12695 [Salmonella enterica]|nr:hypothetical protein LFZ55_21085 [Salmonella enterica subsp. diarizonae serovar 65:c:z str. SA20044251]EAQ7978028.1 hypothetical protein [Salmonella enterica]
MYQALSAVREDDTERTKRRASPGRWQPEGSGCGSNFVQINTVSIIIKSLAAQCEFESRYSGSKFGAQDLSAIGVKGNLSFGGDNWAIDDTCEAHSLRL